MLEAARATVRIYCPECGVGLRTSRGDGGSILACYACGEAIRVPSQPHPLESEDEETPLIPPVAAAHAERGLQYLLLSLALSVTGYGLLVLAIASWVVTGGPSAVFAREQGESRSALIVIWTVDLVLVVSSLQLRWMAYARCRPAAEVLRATSWLSAARIGLALRAVGYPFVLMPWLVGYSLNDTPVTMRALGEIGKLGLVVGWLLEFGIVVLWSRLLIELRGRGAERLVGRYLVTTFGAVVTCATAVSLAGMMMVIALRKSGPPPAPLGAPPRMNFDIVPNEGWYSVLAVALVVVAFAAVLAWQYLRILLAIRASLNDSLPGGSHLPRT